MRSNDEIIDLLTDLKNEKGLSLSELARRVGMAKSGLSLYFNKTRAFQLNKVEVFAKALNVTPEYILGFDTQSPSHEWESTIIKKDERSIQKRLEEIKRDIKDGSNLNVATDEFHSYNEDTQVAIISAIEVALTAMAFNGHL